MKKAAIKLSDEEQRKLSKFSNANAKLNKAEANPDHATITPVSSLGPCVPLVSDTPAFDAHHAAPAPSKRPTPRTDALRKAYRDDNDQIHP